MQKSSSHPIPTPMEHTIRICTEELIPNVLYAGNVTIDELRFAYKLKLNLGPETIAPDKGPNEVRKAYDITIMSHDHEPVDLTDLMYTFFYLSVVPSVLAIRHQLRGPAGSQLAGMERTNNTRTIERFKFLPEWERALDELRSDRARAAA